MDSLTLPVMIKLKDAVSNDHISEDDSDYVDEEEIFMAQQAELLQKYCSQPLLIDPEQYDIAEMKKMLRPLSLVQIKEESKRVQYKPNHKYKTAINTVIHEKLYPNSPDRLTLFNEFVQLLQRLEDPNLQFEAQREQEFKLIVRSHRDSRWRAQINRIDGEVFWECKWIGDVPNFRCNHHELIQSNGELFKQLVWKCITW